MRFYCIDSCSKVKRETIELDERITTRKTRLSVGRSESAVGVKQVRVA
jgi:hypothetical protein